MDHTRRSGHRCDAGQLGNSVSLNEGAAGFTRCRGTAVGEGATGSVLGSLARRRVLDPASAAERAARRGPRRVPSSAGGPARAPVHFCGGATSERVEYTGLMRSAGPPAPGFVQKLRTEGGSSGVQTGPGSVHHTAFNERMSWVTSTQRNQARYDPDTTHTRCSLLRLRHGNLGAEAPMAIAWLQIGVSSILFAVYRCGRCLAQAVLLGFGVRCLRTSRPV